VPNSLVLDQPRGLRRGDADLPAFDHSQNRGAGCSREREIGRVTPFRAQSLHTRPVSRAYRRKR
jgi:hypothetical protein